MAEKEQLHFRIGLSGTYWDKKPQYSVAVNSVETANGTVDTESDQVFYVEFDSESDQEINCLSIRLNNKTDLDVKKDNYDDPHNFQIIGDMLLNIVSVEIDGIDLGHLTYSLSEYHVDHPVWIDDQPVKLVRNCVSLGWNGTWNLTWTNPFYIWLLESI